MALIPPDFLNCVVALGVRNPKDQDEVKWVASGFLVGRPEGRVGPGGVNHTVYLVTSAHVVAKETDFVVGLNRRKGTGEIQGPMPFRHDDGTPVWVRHPNDAVDVAVAPMNVNYFKRAGAVLRFFFPDGHIWSREQMHQQGVSEGDLVYILGFPMGLVTSGRHYPITRFGSIARVRDFLAGETTSYLVDALVFPGNSGGPVISKPETTAITGTTGISHACVIGVVSDYVSYQDKAISTQTGRTRITFEENSGLAHIVGMDFVLETIEFARKGLLPLSEPQVQIEPASTGSTSPQN